MAMSTPAGSNPAAGGLALEQPKLDFKVADFNPSQRNDLSHRPGCKDHAQELEVG